MIDHLSIKSCILTINGGSSSIKFGLFEANDVLAQIFKGSIERIGSDSATLQVKGLHGEEDFSQKLLASDPIAAINLLIDWIEKQNSLGRLIAIGHRVVHGGPKYSSPQKITEKVIEDLRSLTAFAPDHLPQEILLIEAFCRRFPNIAQIVCFDTAFHHDLPRIAKLLPIPRCYEAQGVRRYGFHGLSYEFLMLELERLAGSKVSQGKVVLAHLGSGASLAAVLGGKSIDTSMSFTPTAGVAMSTRSGDLDPGLLRYLALSVKEWDDMVNLKSGLLGMSETSSDIRELLDIEATDVRAAEAVSLFCYQVKKWIGAFAAALGGVDTLVFSGGIGENLPSIRARICEGLGFLGLDLDEKKNTASEPVISKINSKGSVRVIRTEEERMIAQTIYRMLDSGTKEIK